MTSRLNDPVEGTPVDDEVLDDGEGLGTPWFKIERVTILEAAHVQLAHRGTATWTMGDAVDHEAAHATDPLAAIMIEGDGFLALDDQGLVDDIEHFQEGHIWTDILGLV